MAICQNRNILSLLCFAKRIRDFCILRRISQFLGRETDTEKTNVKNNKFNSINRKIDVAVAFL